MPEGNAIVYCEGAFNTPNGKTAHGLVRFSKRYRVLAVVDSFHAGEDAGEILDGQARGIPICSSLQEAVDKGKATRSPATHFVIGLAPDGGRLSPQAREDIRLAIQLGLNVDSGLHDFLSEDAVVAEEARRQGVQIRDVRTPPDRKALHFFSGKIEQVESLKIALLGTDSAVGKRTTAWLLVEGLQKAGHSAELVGTGQTAWMQGARYSLILDSLVNDFVSGEIEHAVWKCWSDCQPDVIVIEGQGSLMNPAYPGGFEILAAARPEVVILQHAPARLEYDGFPGYPIQPLSHQIEAIRVVSGKPVVAITINHENLSREQVPSACKAITKETSLPAVDIVFEGADGLVKVLEAYLKRTPMEAAGDNK